MANLRSRLVNGAAAGLAAGIPQVLLTQAEARLLGLPGSQADIGPRFVQRVAEHLDTRPRRRERWLLAGGFHFGYGGRIDTEPMKRTIHPTLASHFGLLATMGTGDAASSATSIENASGNSGGPPGRACPGGGAGGPPSLRMSC